ncbi:MAG: hypothetical protein Q9186_004863 [Xanthomendoza sp. 1 TL-2023]
MSASLPSIHSGNNTTLPPLFSLGGSALGDRQDLSGAGNPHTEYRHPLVPADIRHGLRTPPGDMNGLNPGALLERPSKTHGGIDGTSIVAYLQIPSSINESKGSLAEFAAQITCLFWFESSITLQYVEDSEAIPAPIQPLVLEAVPTMGFRKWVVSILSTTQVSQNVILLALMFIYRLKQLNPGVKGKLGSEFRLFTVALMLGNKCE